MAKRRVKKIKAMPLRDEDNKLDINQNHKLAKEEGLGEQRSLTPISKASIMEESKLDEPQFGLRSRQSTLFKRSLTNNNERINNTFEVSEK